MKNKKQVLENEKYLKPYNYLNMGKFRDILVNNHKIK